MYGSGRSAGFRFLDPATGAPLFSMDTDVNRPITSTKVYTVEGFQFRGAAPIRMLADKTLVVSTQKVFRRIKDTIDLYYLSHVLPYSREAVLEELQRSGKALEDFSGFLHRAADLEHAYQKFTLGEGVPKPSFQEVYQTVQNYICVMLPAVEAQAP